MLKAACHAMLAALAAVILSGCEAKPAPDTGFIDDAGKMSHNESLPVQRIWKDPDVKMLDYDKIIVKEVRTNWQLEKSRKEKRNLRNLLGMEKDDVAEFAKYTQDSFKKAIEKGPCRLKLVEQAGPGTLSLELSFSKIVQGKPVASAAKTASSFTPIGACLIPVKFAAKGMTDGGGQASLAMEGQLVDSATGKTVATFAQRSKQCTAVLNFEDFSTYGNLEQIVDAWAAKFVEIVNKRPLETNEKIEGGQQVKFINF